VEPATHTPDQPRSAPEPRGAGDPSNWLDEHADAMYRYAMLRLGAADMAEDAVQEALLAGLAGLGAFDGRSSVRTWLIGILRHKVLDILRRRRRERLQSIDAPGVEGEGAFAPDGHWREPVAPWEGGGADRAELREALLRRIAQLPGPMREAFCLRELDGLDSQTVCEILGITPTNLWTIIHRAKLRLRAGLEEDGFGRKVEPGGRA